MQIGYKLSAEGFGPEELIRQAVRAEQAGFDFVEISDHFHPWLDSQGHSPFTWSVLGAIASRTRTIELGTGVTCPSMRYHPAIIAQAAATMGVLSGGRFFLGVGAGERLNEHITGQGFPNATTRQQLLREAVEIIRLLWSGGYHSYEGAYLQLEDARVFDLPEQPPLIVVAVGGPAAARLAAELGDGIIATEPKARLVDAYREAGGTGPRYCEVGISWARDEQQAIRAALDTSRWAVTGWKVMSELPNPTNFAAATRWVDEDDIRRQFTVGPDPEVHLTGIQRYIDAGFDRIVLQNTGPDPDGFFDFFERDLADRIRALARQPVPA
ncbi:MAG TPA: TIGR03557 family F420-dependent LLM class oxidoreductase [Micromonosporaceae bacterium]